MTGDEEQPTRIISASLAVRPTRSAVLIKPVEGLSWLATFEAALAVQCQVCGGQGNIALPAGEGYADEPLFWALLDAFDPDEIRGAGMTLGEMEMADPDWFDCQRPQLQQYLDAFGDKDEEQLSRERIHYLSGSVVDPIWSAPEEESINRRLGTLATGVRPSIETVSAESAGSWPGLNVADLASLPEVVQSPNVGRACGLARRLWATAQHGRINFALRHALRHAACESATSPSLMPGPGEPGYVTTIVGTTCPGLWPSTAWARMRPAAGGRKARW